jgi:outer membrane protein OmpA-like peptidoglycan-associated protein
MPIVSRLLLLLAACYSLVAAAQTHTLTPWKGSAYHIADEYLQAGFGPHVLDGEFFGHIELEALDIELQPEDQTFPGVYERVQFGIIVRSKLDILEAGCYQLSLNSDDGSVLWIDDELAVANDGHHKERRVTDSLVFDKKTYEAKVWYYNAYYGGYALELDIDRIGPAESCPNAELSAPPEEPIVMVGAQLFSHGSYIIPKRGAEQFDELANQLKTMDIKKITIIGHTDDTGEEADNLILSERRAESVRAFLQNRVNLTGVEIVLLGKGESDPVADNSTRAGQVRNRRVEILVE